MPTMRNHSQWIFFFEYQHLFQVLKTIYGSKYFHHWDKNIDHMPIIEGKFLKFYVQNQNNFFVPSKVQYKFVIFKLSMHL